MISAKEFEGELWVKASDCISAISKAVETEREACAKLCDNLEDSDPEYYQFELPVSTDCAAAIRARGQQ